MEAPGRKDRPEGAPEGGEPTRELTAAGGQFLLRADVVEFRRGDLLGGRYQIEKGIGRGATGSVVQAFDRVVRSVVAVKILRPDLATDQHWIERLGGELRYARKLQHPNVCRVFDLGESDGHHYLTMEFAGGGSLRQRLADKPDRSWEDRIADARAVIEGLVAIHAANIVHRDVKPENVLVMDDGRLAVSDFGVAVSAGQTTYFSSKVAGTPSYMAPEVIMGDKATPRADVFSLGIVLHEILFGRRPDWQMTPKGRVIKSVVGKKGSAREKAFARLCAECLKEFAPERLADAAEVKRRFELAVSGRLRPIVGLRHRWPLAVAAVAVAVAGLALGRRTRHEAPSATGPQVSAFRGKAADLGAMSRVVTSSERPLRCFDLLPDRKSLRVVWGKPTEALDVDLSTGKQTRPRLIPDAIANGCPQLSPDGRRLLFVKEDESKRPQIMLSEHADGSDARAVTEGSTPMWLRSGEEFVYSFDNRRGAAFTFPKTRLLFPDSPPLEKLLQTMTVSESGDRVALLFLDSIRRVTVDIYSYPSMALIQHAMLPGMVGSVAFEAGAENRLRLAIPDPRHMSIVELTPAGELIRIGAVRGANTLSPVRSDAGLAFVASSFSRSIVFRAGDGSERVFSPAGTNRADVSKDQAVVFDQRLEDGRVAIAYRGRAEPASRVITDGPSDMFPSFAAQGRSVVFVRVNENSLMWCDLGSGPATNCRRIYTDPLGPKLTSVSPDSLSVAYQTTHGSGSRLRIASMRTGAMADLGVYRSDCPPTWSSTQGLWVHQPGSASWEELDSTSGHPSGRTERIDGDIASVCDRPPLRAAEHRDYKIQRLERQSNEVRLATGF